MKIVTIIGARPQFIKSATVSRKIKDTDIKEVIIHTGQHYDSNMSEVFFKELAIPEPDYNLEVGSASHGKQTAQMLEKTETILLSEKPDYVLVYGDTNSTIAGALAATKLHIPVAHVEAGLRSYNRLMPEEINRIATDRISDILFAPTQNAMNILSQEGLAEKSVFSGDVMYDSVLFYKKRIEESPEKYFLAEIPDEYYLATIHRPQNTDCEENLKNIFMAFSELDKTVVLPLHPRTEKLLEVYSIKPENLVILEPVGYLHMLALLMKSAKVLTDSGGLQKEAYFLGKQCVTLRTETEWIETLHDNWNTIVSADRDKIIAAVNSKLMSDFRKNDFGDGNAAQKIVQELKK